MEKVKLEGMMKGKQSMISLKLEMIEGLKTKSCCQYLEPRLLAMQIYSNKMQQT
jgi:hypothetical protein